jgi:SAM-dependent methyltransferase
MDERFFEYQDQIYPDYIRRGRAANFIIPFASKFCQGIGLDIGGTQYCHFPGAKIINTESNDPYHATNLPPGQCDYIFSSHTLEHIENTLETLLYWRSHLREGGTLFLYLPHPSMPYWHPKNCKKHKHIFTPEQIVLALRELEFKDIICSDRDLYWSFAAVGVNRTQ